MNLILPDDFGSNGDVCDCSYGEHGLLYRVYCRNRTKGQTNQRARMYVIQMKLDRYWRTLGGFFANKYTAEIKVREYMLATTTHLQSREYRVKKA